MVEARESTPSESAIQAYGRSLSFDIPPPDGSKQPSGFGSFILHNYGQSLPYCVHQAPDAGPWSSGADGCLIRQQRHFVVV